MSKISHSNLRQALLGQANVLDTVEQIYETNRGVQMQTESKLFSISSSICLAVSPIFIYVNKLYIFFQEKLPQKFSWNKLFPVSPWFLTWNNFWAKPRWVFKEIGKQWNMKLESGNEEYCGPDPFVINEISR